MATVTLQELRDRVRDRSDSDNGGPVSDSQIDTRINEAIRHVYGELLKVRGDEYFSKDTTLVTVAGSDSVDLPADFLKVSPEGVHWITGTSVNILLHAYSPNESQLQLAGAGWTYHPAGANIRYRIRGTKLRFVPTPTAAYNIKFNYLPVPPTLVDNSDTWEAYFGCDEAIVWLAAAYCLAKEESDTAFAMQQYDRCMQFIREQAPRDENEPPTVQWCDPWINGDGMVRGQFW